MEYTFEEQLNIPSAEHKKLTMTKESLMICLVLLLVGLTGFLPSILQNAALLLMFVLSAVTGGTYLIYPVMLFYGNVLGIFAGMSVYRWFTLLFLAVTLLKFRGFYTKPKQLAVFLLFVLYCLLVVAPEDLRRAIFAVVDMVCVIFLINCYLKGEKQLRKFFTVYVICAFFAFVTGAQVANIEQGAIINGQYVELVRNMATFEDPNYMGFFYTTAIFVIVGFKLFTWKLRVVMVVVLYGILLTSLSVTAIVVNLLLWLVYLLVTKGIRVQTAMAVVLIAALSFGLYQYGVLHPDASFIGPFAMRIQEKIKQTTTGDLDSATTNRTYLALQHLSYFVSQPVYKILIGMNAASAIIMDVGGFTLVAHNEYVDWLLNVGVLGTMLMGYHLFSTTIGPLKQYWHDRQNYTALGMLMVKLVFVMYVFTLTIYGDYRFMMFMLI